ncbi:MAG: hypothetical protein ABSC94_21250 [Polyangiaceae bacterium]|jgi:hypothetical protein
MAHRTRNLSVCILLFAGASLVPLAVGVGACGGGGKPAETPPTASETPSSSAGESASAEPTAAESTSAAPAESARAEAPAPAPAPKTGSAKATTKSDPTWADCYATFKPKGKDKDVSKDVAALAKLCAKATKMKLVGKTLTGKQSDSSPPQSFPLKAAAKHCYRVYAQAGDGVKDLDVAIKDSTGATAGEDSTDSSTAVALQDGVVCFKDADAATVVVSVGGGSGAYAVQIWGD